MKENEDFILRWDTLLKYCGLNAKELANFLNVSHNYVYDLRKGKANPSSKILQKLGEIETADGRINLHWLLLGEGEMFIPPETEKQFDADLAFSILAREFENLRTVLPRIDQLKAENAELKTQNKQLEKTFLSLVNAHQTLQRQHDQLNLRCEGLFAELGKYVKEFQYGNPYKGPMEDEIIAMQRQKLEESVAELKEQKA